MASIATSTCLPAFGEPHEREAIGDELQATLLELVDLSLIGKQLRWSVFCRLFRPLRLFLDELVDSWRELADTAAERAVARDYIPDRQAGAVVARSQLTPVAQWRSKIMPSCVSWPIGSPRSANWRGPAWTDSASSTPPHRTS
jgi:starvation-inducible DNA-binding protein